MKKKSIIIIVAVLLIIASVTTIVVMKSKPDKELEKPTSIVEKDEIPTAPAANTENLTTSMTEIDEISFDTNTIEFTNSTAVKEGELIAVWVYSEPKFLGYFKVILEEGKKRIEGLEDALAKLDIEPGDHNIALVKENGEKLGYIDVKIEDKKIKTEKKEDKKEEPVYTFQPLPKRRSTKQVLPHQT